MSDPGHQGVSHKERMLRSGTRLFYEHGYTGSTVDAVLADAGTPKGSFYHYFGAKSAFGFAVLDRYDASQAELLGSWARRVDLTVPDRLTGYHRQLVEACAVSGFARGCLAGKLSNELAFSSDPYRERLAGSFLGWKGQITALLLEGQQRGEVRQEPSAAELADSVLALIQGGFVAALTLQDMSYLTAVTATLEDLVSADRG